MPPDNGSRAGPVAHACGRHPPSDEGKIIVLGGVDGRGGRSNFGTGEPSDIGFGILAPKRNLCGVARSTKGLGSTFSQYALNDWMG
jgi:hypothetical protein